MSDEQKSLDEQRAMVLDAIRSIVPGHDAEFLLATSEALVQRGFLGPRATLTAGVEGTNLPLFVSVDGWGHPTGCARCAAPYADADHWGVVTFKRKVGSVGVVLCAKCNEKVSAKEAK